MYVSSVLTMPEIIKYSVLAALALAHVRSNLLFIFRNVSDRKVVSKFGQDLEKNTFFDE